jgi:superfamily II DNA/RNA helicase
VPSTVTHRVRSVDQGGKPDALTRVLREAPSGQALVFCKTKRRSDRVGTQLTRAGIRTAVIHGNKSQNARTRALSDFKAGRVNVLVATDIAARGLDIAELPLVVNYDLPLVAEDYVHRVGRTGRMGREGVAYTFVCPDEGHELTRIEERINRLLKRDEFRDFEAVDPRAQLRGPANPDGSSDPVPELVLDPNKPVPPAPPTSLMKRPPKKYKRGL